MTTPVPTGKAPTAGGGAPPVSRVESGPVGSASLYPVPLSSVVLTSAQEDWDRILYKPVYDTEGNEIGRVDTVWVRRDDTVSHVYVVGSNGVRVRLSADDVVLHEDGRLVYIASSAESVLREARRLLLEVGINLNLQRKDIALAEEKEGYILLVLKTGLHIHIPKKNPGDWKAYLHHNGDVTAWQGSEW